MAVWLAEHGFEVVWCGSGNGEVVLGEWVLDGEFGGVKCEAVDSFFSFAFVAVFFVTDYGASFVCEVDADLVFSACEDVEFYEAVGVILFDDFVGCF